MSKRQHRVKDGEHYASVTETALGTLYPQALDEGNLDDAEHLAEVGTVGPYELIPHDEIRAMRLREGRLQAVGVGMAAEANVPKALSLARKLAGYTQAEAAEIVGIATMSLSRYERGEGVPSVRVLVSLAALYGVSVDRMLGIIDEQQEELLDSYAYATPTARERILEVAKGVQAGHSPEARNYAESDTLRLKRQLAKQLEQQCDEYQQWLNEVYEQEQAGHGLSRYTDGMIDRYQSDEMKGTLIRLRDESANPLTDDEISLHVSKLEELVSKLEELRERLEVLRGNKRSES